MHSWESCQVECLLDSFTSTRTAQNLHASRAVSIYIKLNTAPIEQNKAEKKMTQVRLLQLQWNSRGGLAGASMELALPDTARLLRSPQLFICQTLSLYFERPLQWHTCGDPCSIRFVVFLKFCIKYFRSPKCSWSTVHSDTETCQQCKCIQSNPRLYADTCEYK